MSNIVVIGSINTDMVVRTTHIPKPGETIMSNSFKITGGGKGANQAVAVARLGGHVCMIAKVGDDIFGEQAIYDLQQLNVDTRYIKKDAQQPSGVALIAVADNGENSIIVAPGANSSLSVADVLDAEEIIASADYILLQLEIPIETVAAATSLAKKYKAKIILNPAPARLLDDDLLQLVDIIIPNQSETLFLTGIDVCNTADAALAVNWFQQREISTVIITMAEQGCFIAGESFNGLVKAHSVNTVVDTVAAGDTFCGAFAVALSEGMNIETAAIFANVAAAITVTKAGAQDSIPARKEVDEFFFSHATRTHY